MSKEMMKLKILLIVLCILFITGCKTEVIDQTQEIKVNTETVDQKIVREPFVAGQFYTGEGVLLKEQIEYYFSKSRNLNLKNTRALIVPHAGYIYSGQVAAQGFYNIDKDYKKVIIIASNHNDKADYYGLSIPNATHYKTPLGEIKISPVAEQLKKESYFTSVSEAHTTHIIEVELPFLQEKLTDFEIIPIVISGLTEDSIDSVAATLNRYIDEDTLIVISSDLSHYHQYDEAVELDIDCINSIERLDYDKIKECEACGLHGIRILTKIAKMNGWNVKILDYKNSGDTAGDMSRVVGYSSILFYEKRIEDEIKVKEELRDANNKEQEFLLKLARDTIKAYLKGEEVPDVESDLLSKKLLTKQGCFVTLNKYGDLRGCIGHILPQKSLYECVIENSINAAVNDARFSKVTSKELDDIEIEVSILSIPEELQYGSSEDLLNKLRPEIDGVVLKSGGHQSTYLPQVWKDLPNKKEFLSSLCVKGRSATDCWKYDDTLIFTYQAQVFQER